MAGMFESVSVDALRDGDMFTGTLVQSHPPDSLLYRDIITVQLMKPVETFYGTVPVPDGPPVECYCSLEPRINKNSTFSKNWAQDTSPQSYGGLRVDSMCVVLAPEWHGDIWTRFWYEDACYEVDGPPSHMRHSSDKAEHWNITARCIGGIDPDGVRTMPKVPEGSRRWGS